MARLVSGAVLLFLVAQACLLVDAKRSLQEEGFDYDFEEYSAVVPASQPTATPAPTPNKTTTAGAKTAGKAVFSTNATVPAVTLKATLGAFATVADFDTAARARFVETLEANILVQLGVVSNVTITDVTAGSVNVASSVAFTGADSTAAEAAATSFSSALSSSSNSAYVSTLFGTSFGAVTVDPASVTKGTASNPTSGVTAIAMSLMAIVGTAVVLGLSL